MSSPLNSSSSSPLSALSRSPTPSSSPPPAAPSSPPAIEPRRSGRVRKPSNKVTKAKITNPTQAKAKPSATKSKSTKAIKTTTTTAAPKVRAKAKTKAAEEPSKTTNAALKSKVKAKAKTKAEEEPSKTINAALKSEAKAKAKPKTEEPPTDNNKRRFSDIIKDNNRPMSETLKRRKIATIEANQAAEKSRQEEATMHSSSSSLSSSPSSDSDDGHANPYEHLQPPFIKFWDATKGKIVIPKSVAESYVRQNSRDVEKILYLAYGLDMSAACMERKFKGCSTVGMGVLSGYKWIIGASGYPTIAACAGSEVHGIVFSVSKEDLEVIGAEGSARFLSLQEVTVNLKLQAGDGGSGDEESKGMGKEAIVQVLVGALDEPEDGCVRQMEILNKEMNIAIFEVKQGGVDLEYVEGVLRMAVPYPSSPIFL